MTDFARHPSRYLHWKLEIDGAVARLLMNVDVEKGLNPGYKLKLNSYDLGVDLELSDAVQRLRFEHPEVKCVIVSSANPRIFCAGANIQMLGLSSHPFKVNFCKFTNETRCSIEDASAHSGQRYIAALNGTASGGGYELAAACEEIYLVDDGNSAVSLPEVPLLGVLPGTGGLTRLVDKRKVRRDLADVFSTLAEGLKARRAKDWNLIDGFFTKTRFDQEIAARAAEIVKAPSPKDGAKGIALDAITPAVEEFEGGATFTYRHVTLRCERAKRLAELTVFAPGAPLPESAGAIHEAGAAYWPLAAFRELDDAICRLRLDEEEIGLVLLRTRASKGTPEEAARALVALDRTLTDKKDDWLVKEIVLFMARVLRRLDVTAKSLFALVDAESVFAGSLLELALAADRIYMRNDPKAQAYLTLGALSRGSLPMPHGLTRLASRFLASPERADVLMRELPRLDTPAADAAGLVTAAPDELDWDEEVRMAIEERLSLSPDALTGMEASLRFGGPETMDSKIYGRLSAWQNWIFIRPNATGERGALKLYGQPERPRFDWRRT
jgi:benzoyl-CoA-dihydrodiol lyase